MPGNVRIGTSGWQYDSWRGDYYPTGLARRRQLEYLAGRMPTVELNGPFYSLQRPGSYQRWYEETPPGFVLAVKGGRYITHFKRLRGVETALGNFFASGVGLLADKLGPFLWQLPERVTYDRAVLADFLALLPCTGEQLAALAAGHDARVDAADVQVDRLASPLRHALEVRHETYRDPSFAALLAEHGVACVVADTAGRWPLLDEVTADFDYVRLHGHTELYASRYAGRTLDRWAERCVAAASAGRDVYVYFDNDARGHAPHDAERLADRVAHLGVGLVSRR